MNAWDWNAIYLVTFAIGLVLSVVAFMGGGHHLHLGKFHGHGFAKNAGSNHASPLNGFTLVAFLCWFGGTGYLIREIHPLSAVVILVMSAASGTFGASIVFWFLVKVLMPKERTLEQEDTEIVGMLGRLSTNLSAEGFGEMLYSQNGGRRCATVRSEDGLPLKRGAEVLVMRYESGVAYVKRWEALDAGVLKEQHAIELE